MNSKITVLSEYSLIPLTSEKVEIISEHKVNKSIITFSLNRNDTSMNEEVEIEGEDNFTNLIKAITNYDRESDGAFYIPFEGMKQNLKISRLDNWKKNYLIFCLGGDEETYASYAKNFKSLGPIQLEKIFDNINIFNFISLYKEIFDLLEINISEEDVNAWFDYYHEEELYNFNNLKEKILNYEFANNQIIEEHRDYINSLRKYLDNVEYSRETGASAGIANIIAKESILYFIEYYLRTYNKVPKGEHYISYIPYSSLKKIKRYEDYRNEENKKIFFS